MVPAGGHSACKGFRSGLPESRGYEVQTGGHTAGSLLPTLHRGGAFKPPVPSPRITPQCPFAHCFLLILPWGQQGPSHLLCGAGPPAWLSGRSMGHARCFTAAGEANSCPPLLGGAEKGLATLRAPGRTSRGMASSDQPPEGGDLPCLTCAPGGSGFLEPVCPPRLHRGSSHSDLFYRLEVWVGKRGT